MTDQQIVSVSELEEAGKGVSVSSATLNHVTTRELATALAQTNPGEKYGDRARSMFALIVKSRKTKEPATAWAETSPEVRERWWDTKNITAQELDEALQRVGFSPWPGLPVVISDIISHREPVWENDVVVKDANGVIWRNRFGGWVRFGSSSAFAPDVPKRPLKKIEV